MGKAKFLIDSYSRSNVCGVGFENEKLEDLKNEFLARFGEHIDDNWEEKAEEVLDEILEEYEEEYEGINYEIVDDKIHIYDKHLKDGASYGFDRITINVLEEDEPKETEIFLNEIKDIINKKPNAKWVIIDCSINEEMPDLFAYLCNLFEERYNTDNLSRSKYDFTDEELDTKQLLEICEAIVRDIEYIAETEEDDSILYGGVTAEVPICSSNPYAYGGYEFIYECKSDEIYVKLTYPYFFCTDWHLSYNDIHISLLDS